MRRSLSADRLRKCLTYNSDTGEFFWANRNSNAARMGIPAGSPNDSGYLTITVDSIAYRAHRLAWLYVYGEWPSSQIDHINRDRRDNRICNLRLAIGGGNLQNSGISKNNTSGAKGVWKVKNRWRAHITADRKGAHIGYFDTFKAAAEAYDAAAIVHFGEFACTNKSLGLI